MSVKMRTFVATLDDSPGVLNRVVALFRRRAFNIVSLNVGRTHEPGVSQMTLVMEADEPTAQRIVALLEKLLCVIDAKDVTEEPSLLRDMALFKIDAGPATRRQIFSLCERFSARVVDAGPDSVIVEATGSPDALRALFLELAPFGVRGMVQCGAVAMTCDERAQTKAA
jgi:acetolactate synthase I/III small subunit